MLRRRIFLTSAVGALLALPACHDSTPTPEPLPPVSADTRRLPPGHPPIDGVIPPVEAPPPHHGLGWKDAAGWVRQPAASTMRQAQYEIPKVGTDAENAELVVYYFGEGQGGDVASNVSRWVGEFSGSAIPSKTEKRTVGSLPVTIVSAEGTYDGGMAIGGGAPPGPKSGWALLAAIAETPAGPWFFKMTGPRATVLAARPAFDALISSFHTN